jgi:hypothetical protein
MVAVVVRVVNLPVDGVPAPIIELLIAAPVIVPDVMHGPAIAEFNALAVSTVFATNGLHTANAVAGISAIKNRNTLFMVLLLFLLDR